MSGGKVIDDLITLVEKVEQSSRGDSNKRPRRFSWADDEDLDALQNETQAMNTRYQ